MPGSLESQRDPPADIVQSRLEAGLINQGGGDKKHTKDKKRESRVEYDGEGEKDMQKRAMKKQRNMEKEIVKKEAQNELVDGQIDGDEQVAKKPLTVTDSLAVRSKIRGLGSHPEALQSIRKGNSTIKYESTEETKKESISTLKSIAAKRENLSSSKSSSKKRKRSPEPSESAEIETKPAKLTKAKKPKSTTSKQESSWNAVKDKDPSELESVVARMRKDLFSEITTLDPELFWDDEPLIEKQRQWSTTSRGSLTQDLSATNKRSVTVPQSPKVQVRRGGTRENWELKSGRFRGHVKIDEEMEDNGDIEENLAFSHKYIANLPKGIKLSNLNFQIHTINPESSHVFVTEQQTSLRACSVARGKLHVTLGDQKFAISANGMWRIKVGERCMARNLEAEDAVVHVCGVK